MKIAMGADHAGFEYKEELMKWLESKGMEILDFGTNSTESADYPDFAVPAAEAVASGKADLGLLVCGTGIGVSIAANKVKGVRAADCLTVEMAELAREHNNANVLTLGSRLIDIETAKLIADKFINTEFAGGRHQRRVDKIHSLTGR